MASTVNVTSAYQGQSAGEILVQAFKQAQTFEKDLITMLPNNIGSGFLPSLSYSANFQAYACGWDPQGTITFSDKSVALKKMMIQHEICKDKFYSTFESVSQSLWAADNAIPADIKAAILDVIVKNMSALIDYNIWNGGTGATEFRGILPQLTADIKTIKIVGTTVTPANAVAEFAKAVDAVPSEIINMDDLLIVVGRDVYFAYKRAVAGQGFNTTSGAAGNYSTLDYLGMRVERLDTLPVNTIVVYEKRNVAFLTGLVSDLNEVRVSDDEARLDGNIRTKVTFTAAASYTDASRIVYYKA